MNNQHEESKVSRNDGDSSQQQTLGINVDSTDRNTIMEDTVPHRINKSPNVSPNLNQRRRDMTPEEVNELLQEQTGQEIFRMSSSRNIKIFKVVIIIIFIIVFACVNLIPNMSLFKIECLFDYTHDYTSPVNQWFKENRTAKNALLIIGGILSDIIVLLTLGYWTWKGRTWRLPITLVLVYLSKALTSALFKYRYPEGYLWENPGFYSLTTPYGASNDMHFTLHVCLLYVIFQELRESKLYVLCPPAFFIFLYQTTMALCTRGAYIIDLFAAFIFGHFFFILGEQLAYYIDVKLFGLTFQERFPHFNTQCSKCCHPINQWVKNKPEDVLKARMELAQEMQNETREANRAE